MLNVIEPMTKFIKFRKDIKLIQIKSKFQKQMNHQQIKLRQGQHQKNFLSVQKKENTKNKKMKCITI